MAEKKLAGLEPASVLSYFEEICAIPHGSRNTKAISDYLVRFARDRGLAVRQDEWNNVVIKKPASAGYEAAAPVLLQQARSINREIFSAAQESCFDTAPWPLHNQDGRPRSCV